MLCQPCCEGKSLPHNWRDALASANKGWYRWRDEFLAAGGTPNASLFIEGDAGCVAAIHTTTPYGLHIFFRWWGHVFRRFTMRCLLLGLFALGLSAGVTGGQNPVVEPIVELKVAPGKSVFKNSAWDKPIVIKSQDEAASYFGKDALEVIGAKVDFMKQIVLVFAWQGSGGDKLTYVVAESFPEQVQFSLRPGVTDDLRSHSRVFALRSNVKWSVKSPR